MPLFDPIANTKLMRAAAVVLFVAALQGSANADSDRAERVLAIGGAVAEIIYALGEENRLIARDSTSSYPPEVNALPDVGYMRALSPEGVLSVEPDLILARANAGPPEAIEVLQSAAIRWVTVPDEWTAAGADENIRIVAEALDVPEKGKALRAKLAADIAAVEALTADMEDRKRVLFVLSMRDDRIMASGTGTAANGIIRLAGAENAIHEYEGYKQVSEEAVITADPDVILMMGRRDASGAHSAPIARILAHPALGPTKAARDGAIIHMDGLYLLGFGPRVGEAAEDLAFGLYGNRLK